MQNAFQGNSDIHYFVWRNSVSIFQRGYLHTQAFTHGLPRRNNFSWEIKLSLLALIISKRLKVSFGGFLGSILVGIEGIFGSEPTVRSAEPSAILKFNCPTGMGVSFFFVDHFRLFSLRHSQHLYSVYGLLFLK